MTRLWHISPATCDLPDNFDRKPGGTFVALGPNAEASCRLDSLTGNSFAVTRASAFDAQRERMNADTSWVLDLASACDLVPSLWHQFSSRLGADDMEPPGAVERTGCRWPADRR